MPGAYTIYGVVVEVSTVLVPHYINSLIEVSTVLVPISKLKLPEMDRAVYFSIDILTPGL